jgi:hypothetical protein
MDIEYFLLYFHLFLFPITYNWEHLAIFLFRVYLIFLTIILSLTHSVLQSIVLTSI